jgi:arsenite-transporting ATPase
VGKTTCAAARAVAEAAARRVLVVSTDPAHSLGDALGVKLAATPRAIRRGLSASELDAPRAFARWIREHGAALGEALEHGTWLDRADVDALLDLPLPGIDELAGILEIARLGEHKGHKGHKGHYDVIVVDTAPTGHTLRLLSSPQTVAAIADILDALQSEHRMIREQFARVGRPEAADRLIAALAEQARETGEMLRDRARTTFCWVTLPEALSLAESEDGLAALDAAGMRADEIVVNRVLPPDGPCPVCDRRRAAERPVIAAITRRFGRGRTLRIVPADLSEPRGIKKLSAIGDRVIGDRRMGDRKIVDRRSPNRPIADRSADRVLSLPSNASTVSAESLAVVRGAKLLFVGGKGGVGKTTVSAAVALRLARAHPTQRLLLLSTDPAHSIADVLDLTGTEIDDAPKSMRGGPANLFVRELDAARALAARRADLEHALDEIAASLGAASIGGGARSAELMDLAPPGIDELFGILEVVKLTRPAGAGGPAGGYDLIVVDTAPTGHALRLLELPETAREWVQVLMRMLLKYKSLIRPGQLAAELVDVSRTIRELQAMLRDASQTRFLVVTRAAEVPRFETERLLDRLRRLKLAAPAIVVNAMTLAPGRCRRCRAVAAAEQRSLAALRRGCGRPSRQCAIIQTPLSALPPRGVRALDRWAGRWVMDRGGLS